jgi:hypothetical protein
MRQAGWSHIEGVLITLLWNQIHAKKMDLQSIIFFAEFGASHLLTSMIFHNVNMLIKDLTQG